MIVTPENKKLLTRAAAAQGVDNVRLAAVAETLLVLVQAVEPMLESEDEDRAAASAPTADQLAPLVDRLETLEAAVGAVEVLDADEVMGKLQSMELRLEALEQALTVSTADAAEASATEPKGGNSRRARGGR